MSLVYVCDLCGKRMRAGDEGRYVVKMEIYAAAEMPEWTEEDLARDRRTEIRRLVEQLSRQDPDDVEAGVHRAFHYDLCRSCQQRIISDPITRLRASG